MVMGSGWPVAVLHGQDPKKMHNRGMRKQFQIFLQAYYNPVVVFAFFVALFPFCSLIKPSKVFAFGAQNVCKLPIYTQYTGAYVLEHYRDLPILLVSA